MYGRGQLCKLNDSSINNEIHERQRRQDAPVRRRRLLVPHQGVEGQEQDRGSSLTELGGALLVASLRGEASSGTLAFLDRFSWDGLHLPELC